MLTKIQIDYLFDFCQAKGVSYYDVLVELVDHLATAIEKELAEHPDWSFQKALDLVFLSFGYSDFTLLVREKRKAARIYRRRQWWSAFREQLTWPGVWVALGAFLFSAYLSTMKTALAGFTACLVCGMLVLIVILVRDGQLNGRLQALTMNRFLLTNTSDPMLTLTNTIIVFLNLSIATGIFRGSFYLLVIGILNFASFLMCVADYRTIKRLQKQVKNDYPDIFNGYEPR